MAARSAKPRETMQATIDELLALQLADGGWSQSVQELRWLAWELESIDAITCAASSRATLGLA